MLHRTSDVLHKTLKANAEYHDMWTAAEKVTSTGYCLCDNLPSHDDVGRPCPKHAPAAYMVWEHALGRSFEILKPANIPARLIVYKDENRQLHRIDGLPALFAVGWLGNVTGTQFHVRGERVSDAVHLMDRLYWDQR